MEFSDFHRVFCDVFEHNGLSEYATEEKSRKFFALTEHMLEVSKTMNLTAIKEERAIILRHYADSLTVGGFLPQGSKVIDIGCGAGFPCLPLAICRPDLEITALDSTEKRIRYVNETARLLGLTNIKGIAARAEDAAKTPLRESFDVALARAVAELPVLSELCIPFVRPNGKFIAMKATRAGEELAAAERAIRRLGGSVTSTHEITLEDPEEKGAQTNQDPTQRVENGDTSDKNPPEREENNGASGKNPTERDKKSHGINARTIIEVTKTARTPKELPRPYAKILKKPL